MQHHIAHLFPTPEGISLAGVIIAKRHADGTFKTANNTLDAGRQHMYFFKGK